MSFLFLFFYRLRGLFFDVLPSFLFSSSSSLTRKKNKKKKKNSF